jgi:hypothetical protein
MTIHKYLRLKKLTTSQFAEQIGVTRFAVTRYMAGRMPHPDVVCTIYKTTRGDVQPNDFYALPRLRKAK